MFIGPVLLNTPQLTDFVDRAERFKVLDQAALDFHNCIVTVNLLSQKETVKRTNYPSPMRLRPTRRELLGSGTRPLLILIPHFLLGMPQPHQ